MKLRVYVGCALTHAPQAYRDHIEQFKQQLRSLEWVEVLDFVTPNTLSANPDPLHIYQNDIHDCVGTADIIIADLSYPSLGLGWELGTSVEKHVIPVIMCAPESALISNLPIGASLMHEHVSLLRYPQSIGDIFDSLVEKLKQTHLVIQSPL